MNTKVDECKLISGKEAKLAWANGAELEFYSPALDIWFSLNNKPFMSDIFDTRDIRFKPRTITINGIEVPAPFKPKEGEKAYRLAPAIPCGYTEFYFSENENEWQFGAWRTEEEIKQVVAVLRQIFGGSHD